VNQAGFPIDFVLVGYPLDLMGEAIRKEDKIAGRRY
jgi:hypothetical protein